VKACVDASLLVKLVSREPGSARIEQWLAAHVDYEFIAPALMAGEVASAVRKKVVRALMQPQQAIEAIRLVAGLGVNLVSDWDLAERAIELAAELGQPTAHDTIYLALAERERCSLVTSDAAFAAACGTRYPIVVVP